MDVTVLHEYLWHTPARMNVSVYVFSDLLPVRHDSMRAVTDNDTVYHVYELTRWRCSSDRDASLGIYLSCTGLRLFYHLLKFLHAYIPSVNQS